ncbi:MAG: DUF192 domain-containing protein [Pseudomonadota bacterium]
MENGVVNITREREALATIKRVARTTNSIERMKGLLGTAALTIDQGMWLSACNSIHTFFMGYDLDIVYLDGDQKICRLVSTIKPWRVDFCLRARSVLEIRSGEIDRLGLALGDHIHWEASSETHRETNKI